MVLVIRRACVAARRAAIRNHPGDVEYHGRGIRATNLGGMHTTNLRRIHSQIRSLNTSFVDHNNVQTTQNEMKKAWQSVCDEADFKRTTGRKVQSLGSIRRERAKMGQVFSGEDDPLNRKSRLGDDPNIDELLEGSFSAAAEPEDSGLLGTLPPSMSTTMGNSSSSLDDMGAGDRTMTDAEFGIIPNHDTPGLSSYGSTKTSPTLLETISNLPSPTSSISRDIWTRSDAFAFIQEFHRFAEESCGCQAPGNRAHVRRSVMYATQELDLRKLTKILMRKNPDRDTGSISALHTLAQMECPVLLPNRHQEKLPESMGMRIQYASKRLRRHFNLAETLTCRGCSKRKRCPKFREPAPVAPSYADVADVSKVLFGLAHYCRMYVIQDVDFEEKSKDPMKRFESKEPEMRGFARQQNNKRTSSKQMAIASRQEREKARSEAKKESGLSSLDHVEKDPYDLEGPDWNSKHIDSSHSKSKHKPSKSRPLLENLDKADGIFSETTKNPNTADLKMVLNHQLSYPALSRTYLEAGKSILKGVEVLLEEERMKAAEDSEWKGRGSRLWSDIPAADLKTAREISKQIAQKQEQIRAKRREERELNMPPWMRDALAPVPSKFMTRRQKSALRQRQKAEQESAAGGMGALATTTGESTHASGGADVPSQNFENKFGTLDNLDQTSPAIVNGSINVKGSRLGGAGRKGKRNLEVLEGLENMKVPRRFKRIKKGARLDAIVQFNATYQKYVAGITQRRQRVNLRVEEDPIVDLEEHWKGLHGKSEKDDEVDSASETASVNFNLDSVSTELSSTDTMSENLKMLGFDKSEQANGVDLDNLSTSQTSRSQTEDKFDILNPTAELARANEKERNRNLERTQQKGHAVPVIDLDSEDIDDVDLSELNEYEKKEYLDQQKSELHSLIFPSEENDVLNKIKNPSGVDDSLDAENDPWSELPPITLEGQNQHEPFSGEPFSERQMETRPETRPTRLETARPTANPASDEDLDNVFGDGQNGQNSAESQLYSDEDSLDALFASFDKESNIEKETLSSEGSGERIEMAIEGDKLQQTESLLTLSTNSEESQASDKDMYIPQPHGGYSNIDLRNPEAYIGLPQAAREAICPSSANLEGVHIYQNSEALLRYQFENSPAAKTAAAAVADVARITSLATGSAIKKAASLPANEKNDQKIAESEENLNSAKSGRRGRGKRNDPTSNSNSSEKWNTMEDIVSKANSQIFSDKVIEDLWSESSTFNELRYISKIPFDDPVGCRSAGTLPPALTLAMKKKKLERELGVVSRGNLDTQIKEGKSSAKATAASFDAGEYDFNMETSMETKNIIKRLNHEKDTTGSDFISVSTKKKSHIENLTSDIDADESAMLDALDARVDGKKPLQPSFQDEMGDMDDEIDDGPSSGSILEEKFAKWESKTNKNDYSDLARYQNGGANSIGNENSSNDCDEVTLDNLDTPRKKVKYAWPIDRDAPGYDVSKEDRDVPSNQRHDKLSFSKKNPFRKDWKEVEKEKDEEEQQLWDTLHGKTPSSRRTKGKLVFPELPDVEEEYIHNSRLGGGKANTAWVKKNVHGLRQSKMKDQLRDLYKLGKTLKSDSVVSNSITDNGGVGTKREADAAKALQTIVNKHLKEKNRKKFVSNR